MGRSMVEVSEAQSCLSNRPRACRPGIIRAMTERGMAQSDGAPACPFVAFEDDRDERSDRPDHRHRCYAEVHPAPRAIAHQEAYCLSSAFAVCPTFQDWAHREAARARGGGGVAVPPPAAAVASEPEHHHDLDAGRPPEGDTPGSRVEPAAEWQGPRPTEREDVPAPLPPRRNPPRDWAAPPPWAAGSGGPAGAAAAGGAGASGAGGPSAPPPQFLADREARGLAGSSADRVAGGDSFVPPASEDEAPPAPRKDTWQPSRSPERAQDADAELAGLVGGGAAAAASTSRPPEPPSSRYEDTSRHRVEATRAPSSEGRENPSWEQPRRYEAYPEIKTRAALPGLPRLGVMAAALGIAALALFFLPSILDLFGGGTGGTGSNGESPGPSTPVESVVPSPTVPPVPTPQVYVVKSGDTMSKIANKFNVSIDELIAANEDNIKDPDKISIGDQVIIPVPESEQEPGSFESAAPS
jgi:LysM repeat protein